MLRLSAGLYELSYDHLTSVDGELKMMLQGGWNASFSERGVCQNITQLKSINDFEVFNVGANDDDQLVLILDGLTLEKGVSFNSMVGVVTTGQSDAYVSIRDCQITDSGFGTGGALDFLVTDDSQSWVLIVNTLIADHLGDGLSFSVSGNSTGNFKIYQSTIAQNQMDVSTGLLGKGITGLSLDNASVQLDIRNSVLFSNDVQDIDLLNDENSDLEVMVFNCGLGKRLFKGPVMAELVNTELGLDPAFENPALGQFTLAENSPGIMAGQDIGIPGFGSSPNWGIANCDDLTDIEQHRFFTVQNISVYPNPVRAFGMAEFELSKMTNLSIQLFDGQGRLVWDWLNPFMLPGFHQITISMASLAPSSYQLALSTEDGSITIPILKVQ